MAAMAMAGAVTAMAMANGLTQEFQAKPSRWLRPNMAPTHD